MNHGDTFRPLYHFSPPDDWMNDPNGLVYFEREYHLFYQYRWPRHWGHAVSADLVHWTHLPPAIAPDDAGDIWSGSIVADRNDRSGLFNGGGGLVAIYTAHTDDAQVQALAYSTDRGRTWTKYAGNPVLSDPARPDFRDPKVFWYAPTGRWVMVLATGGCASLYGASDLKDWELLSRYGEGQGYPGLTWECCDLFELPVDGNGDQRKWILVSSLLEMAMFNGRFGRCRTQYFVGAFDGTHFVNDNPADTVLWLSSGHDDYAAVSFSGLPDEKTVTVIGWMNHWGYADRVPTESWKGAMTLPRIVSLARTPDGLRLLQSPVPAYKTIRLGSMAVTDIEIAAGQTASYPACGSQFEIVLEIEVGNAREITIHAAEAGDQFTLIRYDTIAGMLSVDRSQCGITDFHPNFSDIATTPFTVQQGVLSLRIFIDSCSIELFAGRGELYMPSLIFPTAPGETVSIQAIGGRARIARLEIYPLGDHAPRD